MSLNNFTLATQKKLFKTRPAQTQDMPKQRQGKRERRRLDPKVTNCVYNCKGGTAWAAMPSPALNQN